MTPTDPRVDPRLVPEGSRPIVIAEHQENYLPVPSILTPDRKVITRWELSDEDRRKLLAGEDVYLTIFGTPIRPVLLSVGPIDWTQV